MQIHELPTGTIGSTEYSPIDDGTSNRKITLASIGNYIISTLTATLGGTSRSVKSAIDTLFEKIAYTSTSIDTGTHLGASIMFKKFGRICTIQIRTLTNLPATTETTIGTIPSGYIPNSEYQQLFVDSSGRVYRLTLQTSGNINIYSYSSSDVATANTRVVVAYMTA